MKNLVLCLTLFILVGTGLAQQKPAEQKPVQAGGSTALNPGGVGTEIGAIEEEKAAIADMLPDDCKDWSIYRVKPKAIDSLFVCRGGEWIEYVPRKACSESKTEAKPQKTTDKAK
jgi:hypothetical protein